MNPVRHPAGPAYWLFGQQADRGWFVYKDPETLVHADGTGDRRVTFPNPASLGTPASCRPHG